MRDDPIKSGLSPEQVKAIKERHEDRLMSLPGVVGVAVGLSDISDADSEDQMVIKVFVSSGLRSSEIPKELEGIPVEIEESGEFTSL